VIRDLARAVHQIGFSCRECGSCCTGEEHRVLLTPPEVRAIRAGAGDDPTVPYPEFIDGPEGSRFTLGRCLEAVDGRCPFLEETRCRIYAARPWICRTYPFWLDGDRLRVDECPGVGRPMSEAEALTLARALIDRRAAEEAEEEGVRRQMARARIPAGAQVWIDSEGCWVIDD